TKEARTLIGFSQVDFADGNDVRADKLEWFERQLGTGQVRGEHYFPELGNVWSELSDLKFNWRASYSEATRDAPYEREVIYEDTSGETRDFDGVFQIDSARRNSTVFSKIEDDAQEIGTDVELPLNVDFLPGKEATLSGGWTFYESNRDTLTKIYRFDGNLDPAIAQTRVDIIYGDSNIGPGLLQLREVGGSEFPEAFAGHLELDAFYFKADLQLTNFLRVSGGVRYEDSLQTSDTLNFTLPDNGFTEAEISSQYGLPSASATWNFTDNMQLRAAYSQTITRPQFRELAFVQFINSETDESFIGNPFLLNSEVENFDARWEYYFSPNEFVTLGVFHKDIDNPIEEVSFVFGDSSINSFINAPGATLSGFEAEIEKNLDFDEWFGWNFLGDREIVLKANYAFTDSEVSTDGEVVRASAASGVPEADPTAAENFIIDGRRLQGQSDHLFNLQLGYDNDIARSKFRILVNYASERIRRAENRTANIPAILEKIPTTVDLTYSRDFDFGSGEYELSIKAQNILGEDYEAFQEGTNQEVIVDGYDRGTAISVGIKRRF
ncbi:MAG: TonB-dependent receptor, partial [Pseudomonadota bacterium]